MKKLKTTASLLFAFSFGNLYSQTINDIPLKEIDADYIQIVGTGKLFKNEVTIEIDFGQKTKMLSASSERRIKDENGNSISFNSMIDALNFMSKNGYEFVNAYAITISNQNVYHYVLRRKL